MTKNIEIVNLRNRWLLEAFYEPGIGVVVAFTSAVSAKTWRARSFNTEGAVQFRPSLDGVPDHVVARARSVLKRIERRLMAGKV